MLIFSNKLRLHQATIAEAGELVARAAATDLRRPPPCDGWDLAALFTHMIGQNNGFATAVAGGDAELAAYHGPNVTPGALVPLWNASATRLREAFTAADPAATVHLAEFNA